MPYNKSSKVTQSMGLSSADVPTSEEAVCVTLMRVSVSYDDYLWV